VRLPKTCKQRRDRTALIDLMHGLNQHMTYTPGATEVDTSAAEAFAGRAGVCQDHTHAFLACARSLGIPSRYVSGYLYSEDASTWPAMPGPKPGWMTPGTALT
jgi:transglutaminase-like putative cysteine protease